MALILNIFSKKYAIFILNAILLVCALIFFAIEEERLSVSFYLPCITIIFMGYLILFNPNNKDGFEPIKFAGGIYTISFGIAPLLLSAEGIYNISYLGLEKKNITEYGALLSLVYMILMISGYYLTGLLISIKKQRIKESINGERPLFLVMAGIAIFFIGIFCYFILIIKSGGIHHFLSFTGSRPIIFGKTFGGYYWATLFMISGVCLLGALFSHNFPKIYILGAFIICVMLSVFQGRDLALAPLFCGLVIINYRYKKFKIKSILILGSLLIILAAFLLSYRLSDKKHFYKDTSSFVSSFILNITKNVKRTVLLDIEQLDVLLISLKYTENSRNYLEGVTLISWIAPLNRHIFDNSIEIIDAGVFLTEKAFPGKFAMGGMIPSLTGELNLNFGVYGSAICMLIYGIVLRLIYILIEINRNNFLLISLYPYSLWIIGKMVVDGFHLLFYLISVSFPIIFLLTVVSIIYPGKRIQRVSASQKGLINSY